MKVAIGVSAKHIHLTKEVLEILFGKGYELTKLKDLKQPNQYAAQETIKIIGKKSEFPKVRILGPLRKYNQFELSVTDCFALGVQPTVRESGFVEDTDEVTLVGPVGEYKLTSGVIVAARHIHLCLETAAREGVTNGDFLTAYIEGERGGVLHNVLARVGHNHADEIHVDTDESNAFEIKNGDIIRITK